MVAMSTLPQVRSGGKAALNAGILDIVGNHEDQLFGSSRVEERRERTRDEIF
jgi:hypothetical protein